MHKPKNRDVGEQRGTGGDYRGQCENGVESGQRAVPVR